MSKITACFGLLCWMLVLGVEAAPVVIWASDPVRPGETVVVRGDAFGKKAKVEVSVSGKGEWKQAEVLQQTEQTLKFVLPMELPAGVVSYRIQRTTPFGIITCDHHFHPASPQRNRIPCILHEIVEKKTPIKSLGHRNKRGFI